MGVIEGHLDRLRQELVSGSADSEINEYIEELKKYGASTTFNIKKELFDWMGCGWGVFFRTGHNEYVCCTLFTLILFYVMGMVLLVSQMQVVSSCLGDMVPLGEKNSCKDWVDVCKVSGDWLSFRGYVTFRTASYFMLLVPFLYMPFVVIMTMNGTLESMRTILDLLQNRNMSDEELKLKEKEDAMDKRHAATKGNAMDEQQRFEYVRQNMFSALRSVSKEGHEWWTQVLFVFFHGVLGMFSLILDGIFVKMVSNEMAMTMECWELKQRAGNMGVLMKWELLGYWQLAMGCIYMMIMLWYIWGQCFFCIHQQQMNANQKEKSVFDMRKRLRDQKGNNKALFNEQETVLKQAIANATLRTAPQAPNGTNY